MAGESTTAVIAAIIGNLAIAVCKFVAAAFSGSAAMLSEAIHSLVDTGNDALMLYGIRQQPASRPTPITRSATGTSSTSGRSSSAY